MVLGTRQIAIAVQDQHLNNYQWAFISTVIFTLFTDSFQNRWKKQSSAIRDSHQMSEVVGCFRDSHQNSAQRPVCCEYKLSKSVSSFVTSGYLPWVLSIAVTQQLSSFVVGSTETPVQAIKSHWSSQRPELYEIFSTPGRILVKLWIIRI